tara:strand:- start:16 stop:483 length:468 start_codon:yes stop_codon:yes gene_type:complete
MQYARKINNCKQCSGIVLSLDELRTWEKKKIARFSKLRKNKLRETLDAGKTGSLNCPKCRKKMLEIELFYKRGRFMSRMEEDSKKPLKEQFSLARGIPIIGDFIGAVALTVDLAGDLKHGKLDKSVIIDSCPSCLIFWFDKSELMIVSSNDLTTK